MKFNEEKLENAIIELFKQSDYSYIKGEELNRENTEVLIKDDLKKFLLKKYKDEEITEYETDSIIRSLEILPSSSLYDSNKKIMNMISEGFTIKREDSTKKDLFIQLIDYENIDNNIFKIVNQMEIKEYHERIPDAIVYVNGLPLVVFEFKSAIREDATIYNAYTQLTVRYRRDIPELFKYNALCVISDGANNKVGSLFAPYEFFYAWRKIDGDEKLEKDGIDSLFTMINGLFNKERFIDLIHNFIYFPDTSTKEEKIVPRYPQYYAANKLLNSVKRNMKPHGNGKGGTYFGATGCGKSFTMLYLTRLLMRDAQLQSPTIVLITDRTDLDDQLSKSFVKAKEFIGDNNIISVESRNHLREQLQNRKSGGVFLTTIQKFSEDIELLTDRNNVVCISDEAHRSQINLDQKVKVTKDGVQKKYGFAKYLHDSLPNATYVGFTGTPIDETMAVFGEIEDSYTMIEAVHDEITVRIVYEGRAAKVTLNESKLREIEDYYNECAEIGANENQIEESKKAVAKMDSIIGNSDRLKLVAKDFVEHYEKRVSEGASIAGKAMFVASNREIAYNLYKEIIELRPEWAEIKECEDEVNLSEKEKKLIKPIEKIKMVMTRNKDDDKELYELLGTKEYRKELDRQYKQVKSNFKIAIVVDMWLTGFDVPELDTIYIDKPIQQHSLIQTISRVNRVYKGKEKGLVVDYIGIKSNMNIALKKYGQVSDDNFTGTEEAVVIVKDQLDLLSKLFYGFNSNGYFNGTPLERLQCLNNAVEFVQQTEDIEKRFMAISKKLNSAYRLCCTCDEITSEEKDKVHFYLAIKSILHKLTKGDAPDAAQMNEKVREMINEAIISEGVEEVFKLDNSEENDDIFSDKYLEKVNKINLPNTRIKLLQKLLKKAISEFKKVNKVRGVDFSKRMKSLVDLYNERKDFESMKSDVLDDVAEKLVDLFKDILNEKNSSNDLGISFEEKAFYDILKSVAEKHEFEYPHNKLINLSKEIKEIVDDKAKYTDWDTRDDIKAELKVAIILTLDANDYPPVPCDEVFKEIFEQAENFKKYSMV
ncbi:HsdR family type I site-specific deoxyribonuclease [Clostridium perfringens]|nr:HsdR family type I site-specific deoxyribonuclease [Clostridium perfringens]MDZ4964281.1 HsdR family type I site-specific deoxyribonuclease [Clostridium perfringens]MDZ5013022.1 HsdR family type I site-specific deoxyribonuclease [Clostridium perfringens]NMF19734.1 type I restriction endonuclease subunit R [Clostridium perfringens]